VDAGFRKKSCSDKIGKEGSDRGGGSWSTYKFKSILISFVSVQTPTFINATATGGGISVIDPPAAANQNNPLAQMQHV
jgi:hypothetical protein